MNPFIEDHKGNTKFDRWPDLQAVIDAVPMQELKKSIYFSINPTESYPSELQQAWFYENGVFPGRFECILGEGAEGTVLKGIWCGQYAAFKFVEIKNQEFQQKVADGVDDLNKRLNILSSTKGRNILFHHGHFR